MTTESDPAFESKPAPPGYRYAGPWIRLAALLIDSVLVVLALLALWLVLGLALAVSGYLLNPLKSSEIEGWPGGAVVYVVESVVMLGWYGGWQAGVGGTPGMLLLRLRVLDPSGLGRPPSAQPSSATRRRSWRVSARLPGTAPLTQGSGWPVAWSSSRSASPSPKARRAKASTTGLPAEHLWCARHKRTRQCARTVAT